MALLWTLRFRTSSDAKAWRRGAAGERHTARILGRLDRHGWVVLHDLAVPWSRANIDHLVIGPAGVFVIDTKQYRGRLQLDRSGMLWHGRYLLGPMVRAARFEADQADDVLGIAELEVGAILAIHGVAVPWGQLITDGVMVLPADRVPELLLAAQPILNPAQVAWLADRARLRFRSAA